MLPRRWTRRAVLAVLVLGGAPAFAQSVTVLFDEDDPAGEGYYAASDGAATGGDELTLAGPDGTKMPIVGEAFSGSDGGLVEYRHTDVGSWALHLGPASGGTVDLSEADSLAFYLNGEPTPGVSLPRVALVAANGSTAALPLPLGSLVGYNAARSGFLDGSDAEVDFAVDYLAALPEDQVRPGYPEDLLVTFSDDVVTQSIPGIGLPATDARFSVVTRYAGLDLAFTFHDADGDGTLSADGEFIQIYTPVEEGSTTRVPTWQIEVNGTPASVPDGGDVYLLSVRNAGVDADPATWQRVGFALRDFGPPGDLDLGQVTGLRFTNGDAPTSRRTLWLDYVVGIDAGVEPIDLPPPSASAQPGDSSVVLRWAPVPGAASYHVYRQAEGGPFVRLTDRPTRTPNFADLHAENGRSYAYVLRSLDAQNRPGPDSAPVEATPAAGLPDAFLDLLQETAFRYFWDEANPANGLVKDRSTPNSASSIAAVGFGLSALTVGIDWGWITREEGRERVLTTLDFFWTCPQSVAATNVCGYKGFFYHFLDMQTGHRAGTTELSTIDTALLLGGVLHAKEYFTGAGADETQIRALADSIYHRVDWTWAAPNAPLVSLAWKPEQGFSSFDWRGYNEAMILYLLALGSPTHPLPPSAWTAWTSTYDWSTHYGLSFVEFPPLFGHQYSHLWFDFRGIQDAYMRDKSAEFGAPIDYFENSRRATLANRAYCAANPGGFPNYAADEWGLTASDDPFGYRAHGAPPAQSDNGTITPTAAGGSIPFTPAESAAALRTFYREYRAELWGPYGFRDAYNVRESWFGDDFLGIDQGPFVIMIENLRTEAVWDAFMANEDVQRGLERAGFEETVVGVEDGGAPLGLTLDAFPNPLARDASVRFTTPAPGPVHLTVYDLLGRRVATLADGVLPAGTHPVAWRTDGLASGVYVLRLASDGVVRTRRVTLVR